ncbi:methyltransferase domain-containing protein [Actinomadura roseirufa]|uniref:methyltransferase domain-containing protein n=1 Tax=Actinomadura roseirufa TaxID=2094049 RepID=UPI001F5E6F98|nr:methyltransferase domain-containing protein [Actinomadura roseirufa]
MPARPPEPTIASLRDAPAEGAGDTLARYWTFYWAVADAQLARWLPRRPSRVLDISGGGGRSARRTAAAGHTVIEVRDPMLERRAPGRLGDGKSAKGRPVGGGLENGSTERQSTERPGTERPGTERPGTERQSTERQGAENGGGDGDAGQGGAGQGGTGNGRAAGERMGDAGRRERGARETIPVVGDSSALPFLGDACVDAVVADDRVLSRHLATESTVGEIARVLRPGGRVLLCVDSLTLGLALLAEQNYWAHLSDVPSAEVVLVPWPDGTITRCFWAEQLRELLTDVGLEVEWIRPRTALSPSTVEHVLADSPDALARLVRTELNAVPGDESLGMHLLASARRVSP